MPIPMRVCLSWLGAAAALLLLAPTAPADEIEPEPYAEEGSDEPATSDALEIESVEPIEDAEAGEAAADATDETAAEEEGEAAADEPNIARFFDVVLFRPVYLIRLAAGLPFFIFYPLTISSGWEDDVVSALWTDPYEATFVRPLGERIGDDY